MKRVILFCLLTLVLFACGGGGAFSDVRISGRVLDITTGAPTTSASHVQSPSATSAASVVDGFFVVGAPSGTAGVTVIPSSLLTYPTITYNFPAPLTQGQNDVGDLWVGPSLVTVQGVVRNAADNNPIANAVVRFAGQFARTDATGTFNILNVAYSDTNTTSFAGIAGRAEATNFLANEFTAGNNTATGGVVNVGVVLLSPVDSNDPPPLPYNIYGFIAPSNLASGTIVKLKDSGGTEVRRFTVGSDARYQFWIEAGQYTLEFANGSNTAPNQSVTLTSNTDVQRKDATLN